MPKTATIKLRLSEDEKANWEAQANADGVTLSSLIRHRMNHPTTRADGVLDEKPTYGPEDMTPEELATADAIIDAIEARKAASEEQWAERNKQIDGTALVGNAIALLAERRSTQCEHGRPQYVFCPTCDGA